MNAKEDVVYPRVLFFEVVAVVRGDDRDSEPFAYFKNPLVDLLLLLNAVMLYLKIEPSVVKCLLVELGSLDGGLHLACPDKIRHLSVQARAKGDKPCVALLEKLLVDPRLVVKSFDICL